MPAPRRRARSIAKGTEGELLEHPWQAQVIGLARFYQWERIYHAPAGGTGKGAGRRVDREQRGRGFPDLVLIRPPELIVAELKTDTGKTTPEQDAWLEAFRAVGQAIAHVVAQRDLGRGLRDERPPVVDAYIWRPRDVDEVNARLGRGRWLVSPAELR